MTDRKGVDICIFDTNGMEHGDGVRQIETGRGRKGLNSDDEVFQEFDGRLSELICRIFDEPAFTGAADDAECRYCPMRRLCGKE